MEEFFYDDLGNLIRQNYKDSNGQLTSYVTFEYNEHGNCTKSSSFTDIHKPTGSFEYYYDDLQNNIKTIERTADGSIFDWYENLEVPEKNLKIYLAKDKNGNIIHRTEENLLTHSELRFNSSGTLYEKHNKKFDSEGRLLERTILDDFEKEKEKYLYNYSDNTETWTLIQNGKLVKTETQIIDNNGNVEYYIRKDKNGKCLEWTKYEFDQYGNKTKYMWGFEEGVEYGFKTIELIYEEDLAV